MSRGRAHATHRWQCDVGGDGGVDCINCGTVDGTRTNDAADAATDDDHDGDGDSDRCGDSDDDDDGGGGGRGDARDNDSDDNDDDDDDSDGDREFTEDDSRPARAIAKAAFDDAIPAPRRPGHHIVVSSSTIRSRCYGFGFV
ncbi:Uncharacterized protein FWK35_00024714 [Aphis craccivora]|uniref:Uncharacterized protein n=1 Tax=Aphis craccivora TaxID=307492 RepID=A0A6G0ZG80_APHCR|nr:Uncharacterized protein FWK35_00024714 [Aphis craccivora]